MSELIQINNVSKCYRLGAINRGMLVKDIQSWWARKRGRQDPHAKIGEADDRRSGDFWALRNISFSISAGETLAVVGRNGAGKSTLLKILSRITAPTKGVVKIRGRISSLLEVGTGFHGELTGRENIFLNGAILGMSKGEVKKKFDEIVDFSEIGEFIDTPVKRYSSGMYVRLAFAVAAHLDPEVLIVDEVLAVGDLRFQKKCLGKMADASTKEGRTVIFVSHNMAAVQRLCHRAVVIEKGRVVADGPIGESLVTYFKITGSTSDSAAIRRFSREQMASDATVFVEEVSLKNAIGEACVSCSIEDSISIEMTYCIEAETAERHVPTYQFTMADGSCAFVATATNVETLPRGRYRATLTVNGNFMNAEAYSIDVAMMSYNLAKGTYKTSMYERGIMSVVFTENERSPQRYCYVGHIPGAVRPIFPWSIAAVG